MKNVLAPKPVHPTAIRNHGLFGETFVKQHMMIDPRWSMGAIIDEFYGMTNLLARRVVFENLENRAQRRRMYRTIRNLRSQCRNGRLKLQNILLGDNVKVIRNYLLNCKEMQRLYQKMPVNMVVDNINQRTFILRRERDRLDYRLEQLKEIYNLQLLERAAIENRIKYENEFILEEEVKMRGFLKNVEKSKIRLKAIKTINSTYKKVIQVLRHDEIFYEPILRSLTKDIEDQSRFIKHILYLGSPAIARFKKLSEEYKLLDDKQRRTTSFAIHSISSFKRIPTRTIKKPSKAGDLVINISKRYTRETKSMLLLKSQLENIESIIKHIKMATLCSKAKEIFPRFQSQIESNFKLMKQNDVGEINHEYLTFKEKMAAEKQNVLLHNFSEEEEKRLLLIQDLEQQVKAEDVIEDETVAYMKNRADVFVLLRFALWNISDILRNVGRPTKLYHPQYPNSYLKLPLLKFEMHTMRACAPELFEEDTKKLLDRIVRKLRALMKAFNALTDSDYYLQPLETIHKLWEEYHSNLLATKELEDVVDEGKTLKEKEDLFEDSKATQNVPNRKQIKMQSAKLVEELSKKED